MDRLRSTSVGVQSGWWPPTATPTSVHPPPPPPPRLHPLALVLLVALLLFGFTSSSLLCAPVFPPRPPRLGQLAFSEHLNHCLRMDPYLTANGYLPISHETNSLFTVIGDGILLWCVPPPAIAVSCQGVPPLTHLATVHVCSHPPSRAPWPRPAPCHVSPPPPTPANSSTSQWPTKSTSVP